MATETRSDDLDRHDEVRVVGDDNERVGVVIEGIEKQEGRDVDVLALLFGLEDFDRCWEASDGVHEAAALRALEVEAFVDRQIGYGAESSEVGILALRLTGISRPRCDTGGEVAEAVELIVRE